MMRRNLIAISILLTAGSLFGADLFTVYVPMDFTQIHPSISHITLRCDLNAGPTTVGEDRFPTPGGVVARKGQPPNLMLYPVGSCAVLSKSDPVTGVPLGTGCYRGTATVMFRTEDFPIGFDPNYVQYAHCYFGLRATDGTLHQPGPGSPFFDQLLSGDSATNLFQPENLFPAGLGNWRPGEGRYPYRWQVRVYFPH